MGLFHEAECAADADDLPDAEEGEDDETIGVPAHQRRKCGRRPIPVHIPRVEILHDLSEDEKVCTSDGHRLQEIGREICEQPEIIPATIQVLRHVRPKYACPHCKSGVQIAPLPPQPIPKSLAAPGLLAHVAISKYGDGLPLSYLWVWRGGSGDHPLVLYDYAPSRGGEVPKRLLEGFRGYLQVDGYEGYNKVCEANGLVRVGCFAHARRKFDEALKAQRKGMKTGKKRSAKVTKAQQGLDLIRVLYQIERQIADEPAEERYRVRQQHAKPQLEKIREWLDGHWAAFRRRA